MFIIVGLGNPGREYEKTRHNVGFMAVDYLAKSSGLTFQEKNDIYISKGILCGVNVMLLKPQSYMNCSGVPVSKIANFYKVSASDIFVIYDDIDVLFGRTKYKNGGSDGGHNGIRSLNSNIGKGYNKVRIGVSRPDHSDVAGYVLSDFTKYELGELEFVFNDILTKLDSILIDRKIFNS